MKTYRRFHVKLFLIMLIVSISYGIAAVPENMEPFWRLSPSPPTKDVTVLSIDSNDVLYAAAWGDGIYKSINSGINWMKVSEGLTNTCVTRIEITKSGKLFASTFGGGIFYSNNGGMNWTAINGNLGNLYVKAIGIYSDSSLIAGTFGSGVYKTTDLGQTWEQINGKLLNYDINCIIIAKDTSFVIGTNGGGIYRSTNYGEFWLPVNSGLKSLTITDFTISRLGDLYATTLGGGVYVSLQNGSGWQHLFNKKNQPLRGKCIAMINNDEPIVGTYGRGAVRLDLKFDGIPGDTPWRNTERTSYGVNDIAVNSKGDVFTAQPDNGILISKDGGYNYTEDTLGFTTKINEKGVAPVLPFNSKNILATSVYGGIYLSTDRGNTWALKAIPNINIKSFYRAHNGKLYAATQSGPYESDDNGETWTHLNFNGPIFSVAANSAGAIFIGDSCFHKSTDNGISWKPTGTWKQDNMGNPDLSFVISIIELDSYENIYCNMFVKTSDSTAEIDIVKSTDAGETWNTFIKVDSSTVHQIRFKDNKIYCAADTGVLISSNNGASWSYRDYGIDQNITKYINFTDNGSLLSSDIIDRWIMKSRNDGISWDTLNVGNVEGEIKGLEVSHEGDIYFMTTNLYRAIENEDLEVPSPILPVNDIGGQEVTPLLKWTKVDNTDLYEMQISKGNKFDVIAEQAVTGDTKWTVVGPLEYGQKYFWRVRSKRNSSVSDWSETASFYTAIAPPELIFPENNSFKNDTVITFRWKPNDAAGSYAMQLSEDDAFTATVADEDELDTNQVEVKGLKTNTDYYWRAKNKSFLSNSNWSEIWKFTTKMAAPLLVSPKDSANLFDRNVTLKWDTVAKATQYSVLISRDEAFTDIVYEGPAESDSIYRTDVLEVGKQYFWKIKALNELNESYWSEVRTFTIKPEGIALISPEDESTDVSMPVLLVWRAPDFAEEFVVQVSTDKDFNQTTLDESGISDTSFLAEGLDVATYFWRVKYKYGDSYSDWSEIWSFTTSPGEAVLVSPADSTKNTDLKTPLKWDGPKNAETYHLQVATDPDFQDLVIDEEGLNDKTYTPEGLENYTVYYWRVRFKVNDIYSSWSDVWTFTTVLGAPQLVYPSYDAKEVETNPEFTWEGAKGAQKYHLQVSPALEFSSLVIDDADIKDIKYPSAGLDTMTTYYWRIKTANSDGESGWSTAWKFTTNNISTGVEDEIITGLMPEVYPMPFKDELHIGFTLIRRSLIKITVLDESGRQAAVIADKAFETGRQSITWYPGTLSSGTYYIHFNIGRNSLIKKAVLLK